MQHIVVNCFQISIFAVANTTVWLKTIARLSLWIAFKLVSLQLQTQQEWIYQVPKRVVNCFQISIFAVANTTRSQVWTIEYALWIAFKLVSLQLQTQQLFQAFNHSFVVNCFQISIFAVANTTMSTFSAFGHCCELLSN